MSVLAIDIGGTKTIAGIVDASGCVLSRMRVETPGSLGPNTAIGLIKEAAHCVVGQSKASPEAVGIACGGPLDRHSGTLGHVPNLPGWTGLCLTEIFGNEFGTTAYLENDATAAAIGELTFGAGKGVSDFVYFTVSTGIGGGIIAGGKPYRGHCDNAAEFGHQKILPEGPTCGCGDRGCLEALASGTAIARIANERLVEQPDSVLRQWSDSGEKITGELVTKAAAQGDPLASDVWQTAMYHLGLGIANVVNILNPALVILGGGVTNAGEMLFGPVRRVVKERTMRGLDEVEIIPAANGDLVGLMGAAAVAIRCGE